MNLFDELNKIIGDLDFEYLDAMESAVELISELVKIQNMTDITAFANFKTINLSGSSLYKFLIKSYYETPACRILLIDTMGDPLIVTNEVDGFPLFVGMPQGILMNMSFRYQESPVGKTWPPSFWENEREVEYCEKCDTMFKEFPNEFVVGAGGLVSITDPSTAATMEILISKL